MPAPSLRHDSLALALRTAAQAYAVEIETQLKRAGQGHHTGVHRARKALARLRALLSLLHATPARPTLLEQRLRAGARKLSRLRDAQAAHGMARRLARSKLNSHVGETWASAIDGLEADRDLLLQAELRADPDLSAQRDDFSVLRTSLDAYEWTAAKPSHVESALRRSARRARRARKQARAASSLETRHSLRRRMRRLLLQIQLLQAIAEDKGHPRAAKRARKLVAHESKHHRVRKRLIDALGDERDLYLLRHALKGRQRTSAADPLLSIVDRRLSKAVAACDKLID